MDINSRRQSADVAEALAETLGVSQADYFIERNGERFAGVHLIVDLIGARHLSEPGHIEQALRRCVEVAGATLLHIHLHHFGEGGGVSGVAVLAESHITIHTWPERDFAALDIFMCGGTRPEAALPVLQDAFQPAHLKLAEVWRGRECELGAVQCR